MAAATGHVLRSFGINGGQPMGIVPYDSSRQPLGIYTVFLQFITVLFISLTNYNLHCPRIA